MSGPQGSDQTQPWPGQDQPSSDPSNQPSSNQPPAWQQPAPGHDQQNWQPPAYTPQQYPSYQQPGHQPYTPPQQYPPTEQQYGQQQEGSKRSLALIGGIVGLLAALIVAVVAVLGFWKPGFFVTTKLDVGAAQSGVQQILTDESNGYGAKNVKDVKCNGGNSPTVKKGDTFNCEVSIDGTKRQVTVTFQDDKGTYEVGRPK
jgi:Domain of unknown function (DUF4333)